MDTIPERPWSALPPTFGDQLRDHLAKHADRVSDLLIPTFGEVGDPQVTLDIQTAVLAGVLRFFELPGTTEPALTEQLREVFRTLGVKEARENRRPATLLLALRWASRVFYRMACEALDDGGDLEPGLLVEFSDAVSVYIDELAVAATEGFGQEVALAASARETAQRAAIALLLGGEVDAVRAGEAVADCGWPQLLDAPVCLAVMGSLTRPIGLAQIALTGEYQSKMIALSPGSEAARLQSEVAGQDAVLCPPVHWTQLAQLWQLTLRVPLAGLGAAAELTDWFTPLLLDRGPAAQALARIRLAPLLALPTNQRDRLAETLVCWLRHWGSRSAVATQLFVHPQTVGYRIGQLRDLFGAALDDPDTRSELQLACATLGLGGADRPLVDHRS